MSIFDKSGRATIDTSNWLHHNSRNIMLTQTNTKQKRSTFNRPYIINLNQSKFLPLNLVIIFIHEAGSTFMSEYGINITCMPLNTLCKNKHTQIWPIFHITCTYCFRSHTKHLTRTFVCVYILDCDTVDFHKIIRIPPTKFI